MSLRAEFQKSYLMRYALLAGFCLFLAAWFGYDGLVGYPSQLERAQAYDQLRKLDAEERQTKWDAIASEHGWPRTVPEKRAEEIEDAITGQYVWAGLCLIVGIPALVLLIRSRGRWVEETENGLTTSWGQTVDFSTVTSLNKRRWAKKGIARATYEQDGAAKTFVFDDFKFEREPLDKLLAKLETHLKPEQIVGGPPEASGEEDADKNKEENAEEHQGGSTAADNSPSPPYR